MTNETQMTNKRHKAHRWIWLAPLVLAMHAGAQTWPSKPIRMISGASPGSASDVVARSISEKLQAGLGQPVIIENRLGAGGSVGAGLVARSDPDGHTYSVHTTGITVNPHINPNQPFDVMKDLAGVATLVSLPNVLIVSPAKNLRSLSELVAWVKANPAKFNYASAGPGSATHMNMEKLRVSAGMGGVHVPYKGSPEAITDVMANRVDVFFAPLVSAVGAVRDGKVLALAVGSAKRSALLPDVPTTLEAGYPGSDFNFWVGWLAPAKTPREIVQRMSQELIRAAQLPDVRERLAKLGAEPFINGPEQMDAMLREEYEIHGRIVKAAGIGGQ